MAFSPGRHSSNGQRGLNGSITNPSRPGLQLRDEASLNILIPMGGGGEAFREAGYAFPKPLIKIVGRPMLLHLLDNLQTRLGDVVWLVVPEALYAQYEATLCLSQEYPEVDIRVVTFNMKTRGAVETLFIGLRHMSETELNRRVVCLDCDTLYFSDVLGQFRSLPKENGACFYFVDQGSRAMYSYLRVGADDLVKEVREKNAISRMANVGAYGFPSARALRTYIQAVLDQPDRVMETYYVSNIINKMVTRHPPSTLASHPHPRSHLRPRLLSPAPVPSLSPRLHPLALTPSPGQGRLPLRRAQRRALPPVRYPAAARGVHGRGGRRPGVRAELPKR